MITSGTDGSGLFGGGDLSGQSFTAKYVFDTDVGSKFENYSMLQLLGGTAFGWASPVLSAKLTIWGHTVTFNPQTQSQVDEYSQVYGSGAYTSGVLAKSMQYSLSTGVTDGTMIVGSKFLDFSGDVSQSNANNYGSFSDGLATSLSFHKNYVTTDQGDTSATPEPASWALMLGGFGMIGGALRRRRTIVSFA